MKIFFFIFLNKIGCIELREDSVETLLATARLLQLNPVVKACCQFLRKQLHPSNCLGIRMFADTQGCSDLLDHAHAYTTKHFMEVTKNQEFLLLSANEVAKLLESEDLNVPSEEIIFHVRLYIYIEKIIKKKLISTNLYY